MPLRAIPATRRGIPGSGAAFFVFETVGFQDELATGRDSVVPTVCVIVRIGVLVTGRVSPGFTTVIKEVREFFVLPIALMAVSVTVYVPAF